MGAFILGKSKKNPASARPKISISPWDLCWRPCFAHENLWGHRVWNTHQDQSLPLQPNISIYQWKIPEGNLEVKFPTIWTEGKAKVGRVREEKIRDEKESQERRFSAGKGRKVAIHCVFSMICVSRRSKSRLAKAAGAEPSGQMRDEKLHAVVARSTFRSQNVQNTPFSDHFWKLRCRKSARHCGAKHISKSKALKNWRSQSTFGSCDVEKVHTVVARSKFRS